MWCCWIVDLWPRPGGPRCRTGVDRGGTERALAEAGLLVTAVSDVTGFPGWRQRGARRIAAGRHETQPTDEGWIAQRRGVGFAEKESSRGLSCAPTDRTRASTAGTAAPVCTGRADARRHSDGSDADRRFRGGAEYLRPGLAGEGEQFGGDGGPAGRRRPQPDLHLDEGPTPPSGALHGRRRSGRDPSTRRGGAPTSCSGTAKETRRSSMRRSDSHGRNVDSRRAAARIVERRRSASLIPFTTCYPSFRR